MYRTISLLLIVCGLALTIIGFNATESLWSSVTKFFTGSPSDKAMWLVIGGVALLCIGVFGSLRGSKAGI